jgi:hypothetical protein
MLGRKGSIYGASGSRNFSCSDPSTVLSPFCFLFILYDKERKILGEKYTISVDNLNTLMFLLVSVMYLASV